MTAALGARAERHLVERLESAVAYDAASAAPLDSLGRIERRRLRRLIDRGIVVEATPGRFYVHRELWTARHSARHTVLLVVIAVVVLLLVALAVVRRVGLARP